LHAQLLAKHEESPQSSILRCNPMSDAHFGFIVRDENQLAQVRDKVTKKYGMGLIEGFRCAFRDPFGNRMDVVDLHDESLVWLLPYQEVQEAGIRFAEQYVES
jgi:hypothetical protein